MAPAVQRSSCQGLGVFGCSSSVRAVNLFLMTCFLKVVTKPFVVLRQLIVLHCPFQCHNGQLRYLCETVHKLTEVYVFQNNPKRTHTADGWMGNPTCRYSLGDLLKLIGAGCIDAPVSTAATGLVKRMPYRKDRLSFRWRGLFCSSSPVSSITSKPLS